MLNFVKLSLRFFIASLVIWRNPFDGLGVDVLDDYIKASVLNKKNRDTQKFNLPLAQNAGQFCRSTQRFR